MGKNDSGWNLENSCAKLPELFYTPLKLETVNGPKLVILNHLLTENLGLNAEAEFMTPPESSNRPDKTDCETRFSNKEQLKK